MTVTAQKIPQDEREVPLSLTVIGRERISRAHITTPDDISRFSANTVFSDFQLFVRGIGTANSFGFDPSVAVFVDGVYLGRATAAVMPLLDLAQIEVIRGPQGALLGKNTIGGAVSFTTADPEPAASGAVEALHGDLDPYGFRAAASVPIGDEWGLRVAVMQSDAKGFVHNSTLDTANLGLENQGFRVKLAWLPGGRASGWLSLENADAYKVRFGHQLSAATPESLEYYRRYDAETETDAADYHTALDTVGTGGTREGRAATLNAAYALDEARFTSLTNVAQSDFSFLVDADFSPAPLIVVTTAEAYDQFSQELRANGRWADVDYITGAHFSRASLRINSVIVMLPDGSTSLAPGGGEPEPVNAMLATLAADSGSGEPERDESRKDFRQESRSAALYGQLTWHFASQWSLTGGLRWTRERKDLQMSNTFARSGAIFIRFLGEEAYDVKRQRNEDNLSPKLALQYEWTPQIAIYAAAARGFKGGGFNDVAPRPEVLEFGAERSDSAEVGFKALFLDGVLAVNASAFNTDLEGLQVSAFDGTSFYVQNAARVETRGMEIESRWQVTSGLSAFSSLGYLDARYASFPNAPARADQDTDSQDLSGAPLMRAPKTSGIAGLEYVSAAFGPGLSWRAGLDAQYRDRTFLNLDNDPIDSQPAHTLWNADLGIGSVSGHWSLRLSGKNLTDGVSRKEAGDVSLFPGNHFATVDQPRRYLLTLNVSW